MPVDVEVADIAMALLANAIGHPATAAGPAAIQGQAIIGAQPLASQNLLNDGSRRGSSITGLEVKFIVQRESWA